MSFGDKLCELRKAKGLTQEQLANMIGVAKSTLTGYEKNNREPNIPTLKKIAVALNVMVEELLGIESPKIPVQAVSDDEIALLNDYRLLNTQGKDYITITMAMAVGSYASDIETTDTIKSTATTDTVRMFRAAKSDDNKEGGIVDMPRATLEKLRKAPTAEEI